MFRMAIVAQTMTELKSKLLEAGNAISTDVPSIPIYDTKKEDEDLAETYQSPIPEFRNTPPKMDSNSYLSEVPSDDAESDGEDLGGSASVGSDFDSKGIPWDKRIHSATKAVTKDGSWRSRRGVEPAYVKQIEATLTNAKQPATPAFIPPVPATNVVVPPMPFQAPPVSQPAPVAAAPAPMAAQTQPITQPTYENIPVPNASTKPAHTLQSFKDSFIQTMSQLIMTKAIDQNYIESLKQHFGVNEIWEVTKNDSQVSEMFENFVSFGMITRVG